MKNLKQNRKTYDDNETLEQKERLKNVTKNEKSSNQSKRDLYAKWSMADGYNSARMVNQIELEEEEIVEEVNKESALDEAGKHQDDIYYLDGNSSLTNEANQTNSSAANEEQPKLNKQNDQQKFHLDQQRQEANFHFSEDDENDNEEGDSDLDQVISTTTITSLNYAVKQHLDKKQ